MLEGRNLYRLGLDVTHIAVSNQAYLNLTTLVGEWQYQNDQFNRFGLSLQDADQAYKNIDTFLDLDKTVKVSSGADVRDSRLANLTSFWTRDLAHPCSPELTVSTSFSGEITTTEFQGFCQPNGVGNTRLNSERLLVSRPVSDDSDLANANIFNAQSAAAAISRFRPVSSSAAAGAYWYFAPPSGVNSLGTHRAFGDAPTVPMPTSGLALYSYVGGTVPTDNYGRAGTFSGSNLVMNFGNQKVTNISPMSTSFAANAAMNIASTYTIPSQNWSMAPGTQVLSGVTIACVPTCPGNTAAAVSGTFTGAAGQGYLLGAQLLNSQLKVATPSANSGGNVSVYAKQ